MGRKILLVDDEPDILQVLSFRLSKAGYDTVAASNGNDALQMMEDFHPDLVLLDVMMPGMDGFETCTRMKKSHPQSRVVIYTAKIDGINAARARESGADDFTVKTTDLKYILESISHLMDASA